MRETHSRSLAKAITWRFIASLTTAVLVYMVTGSFKITLGVSAVEITAKLIFYYLHERAWNLILWGKKK